METLVIGLGNPILTDDGVGVRVAQEVAKKLPIGTGIDVRELSVGGLALMEHMLGYERVIIIDAIQTEEYSPGKIRRMTLEELRQISPTQHSTCAHDTSLTTALELAVQMDLQIPKEITIFTVEVDNLNPDTPDIRTAIDDAVEALFLTKEPFIQGLTVTRNDTISDAETTAIVQTVAAASGSVISDVIVKEGGIPLDIRTLGKGEKAKVTTPLTYT